jgi:hypothetical protein
VNIISATIGSTEIVFWAKECRRRVGNGVVESSEASVGEQLVYVTFLWESGETFEDQSELRKLGGSDKTAGFDGADWQTHTIQTIIDSIWVKDLVCKSFL